MLELEHHAQLPAVLGAVFPGALHIGAPRLPYSDQALLDERLPGQLFQELVEPGAVAGDLPVRVLGDLVDDVQPEALHALVHPEADHVVQLPAEDGVLPVQIRLLDGKLVKIVLLQQGDVGPHGAAEYRLHVVGR